MRDFLRLLPLVVLFIVGLPTHAQETRIGHIDRSQLVMQMPERTTAITKLEAFAKTIDGRLKAMGEEYKTKRTAAETPSPALSKTERDMQLHELQDLEQRIMDAQEKAEADIAKLEQELMQPIIARADEAIGAVAGAQRYTYVLDSGAGLLMYPGGTDLMAAVKAQLGIK